MTWSKLGDEFSDECWTLTDSAFRLHVEGLVWSNRKGADGKLAKYDMRLWAKHPHAADELVQVGWWTDRGDHYVIIHHIGYQRTRRQVANQSIVNRANRAKGTARPVRPKDDSSDDWSDERDRTGQAFTDRGTSLRRGDESSDKSSSDRSDEVREMYAEDERAHLEAKADRIARDGYNQ